MCIHMCMCVFIILSLGLFVCLPVFLCMCVCMSSSGGIVTHVDLIGELPMDNVPIYVWYLPPQVCLSANAMGIISLNLC